MKAGAVHFLLVLLFGLLYLPSLGFGFFAEDSWYAALGFRDIPGAFMIGPDPTPHFRPLSYMTFPPVNAVANSALAHRAINLALFLGIVTLTVRRLGSGWTPALATAVVFSHPAFAYPVTWFSQRSDLILMLTLAWYSTAQSNGLRITMLTLSTLARSPFVFQVLLSLRPASRRSAGFLVPIAFGIVVLAVSWWFTFRPVSGQEGATLFARLDASFGGLVLGLAGRAVKIVEGLIYVFVPFPAVWGHWYVWPVTSTYAFLWGALFYLTIRARALRINRDLALGLTLAIPFAVNSELRVVAPAALFLSVGIFRWLGSAPSRAATGILAGLLILNLVSTLNVYRFADSGLPDSGGAECPRVEVPSNKWLCLRHGILERLIASAS